MPEAGLLAHPKRLHKLLTRWLSVEIRTLRRSDVLQSMDKCRAADQERHRLGKSDHLCCSCTHTLTYRPWRNPLMYPDTHSLYMVGLGLTMM